LLAQNEMIVIGARLEQEYPEINTQCSFELAEELFAFSDYVFGEANSGIIAFRQNSFQSGN